VLPAPVGARRFTPAGTGERLDGGAVGGRLVRAEPAGAAQAQPVEGPGRQPVPQAGAGSGGLVAQVAATGGT
jgi:hypothetical protein